MPQSGGEDARDELPSYITNPASAPARDTWYAEPAKVFDNLYFLGGKVHSAWALTTKEGIILIDTIYPYNSEELVIGGGIKGDRLLFSIVIGRGAVIKPAHAENPARAAGWICLSCDQSRKWSRDCLS